MMPDETTRNNFFLNAVGSKFILLGAVILIDAGVFADAAFAYIDPGAGFPFFNGGRLFSACWRLF